MGERALSIGRRGLLALGAAAATVALLPAGGVRAQSQGAWARIDAGPRAALRRGVSLSHWFWEPLRGESFGSPQHISDGELEALRALNLGHLRLAVDIVVLLEDTGRRQERIDLLNRALDRIETAGFFAVVTPFGNYNAVRERTPDGMLSLLDRLSRLLAARAPDRLALALANEPAGVTPQEWSPLQNRLAAVARAHLPLHLLIAAAPVRPEPDGGAWGAHHALMQTEPPSDPNLAVALHWYEPFWFTHAGAPWATPAEKGTVGTGYRGSDWATGRMAAEIESLVHWAGDASLPLFVAEFGVFRHGGQPEIERVAWARDCVLVFERFGLPWCWWDYCEGFGLAFRDAHGKVIDVALAAALGLTP